MYYNSLWHPSTYKGIVGVASIVVGIVPVRAAGRHHRRRCSMTAVSQCVQQVLDVVDVDCSGTCH